MRKFLQEQEAAKRIQQESLIERVRPSCWRIVEQIEKLLGKYTKLPQLRIEEVIMLLVHPWVREAKEVKSMLSECYDVNSDECC